MRGINVIEDGSLRATASGFEVRLRYKWYRSLQLSCVENFRLSLDGQPVDPAAVTLAVNGRAYRLSELADKIEDLWFIQDSAIARVERPGSVQPGESHQVDVVFGLRVPYIPIGPDKFLTIINKESTTLVAA